MGFVSYNRRFSLHFTLPDREISVRLYLEVYRNSYLGVALSVNILELGVLFKEISDGSGEIKRRDGIFIVLRYVPT